MTSRTPLMLSMLAALLVSPPVAAQEDLTLDPDSPVRRIRVVGADGDFYYTADCRNLSRGSIVVREQPRQVCATPQHGEERCLPAWRVVAAAEYTCR